MSWLAEIELELEADTQEGAEQEVMELVILPRSKLERLLAVIDGDMLRGNETISSVIESVRSELQSQ